MCACVPVCVYRRVGLLYSVGRYFSTDKVWTVGGLFLFGGEHKASWEQEQVNELSPVGEPKSIYGVFSFVVYLWPFVSFSRL